MARTYTQDFVNDAVRYVEAHPDLTMKDAANNLGIPKETLYGWVRGSRRKRWLEMVNQSRATSQTKKKKSFVLKRSSRTLRTHLTS